MPENRHLRFLLVLLYIILGVLGAYIIFKYILKWLLPFVIAFIIAALLKRPVTFLTKKLRLSRGIVSLFMVIFVYGVVGTGLGLFISFIIGQLRAFAAIFQTIFRHFLRYSIIYGQILLSWYKSCRRPSAGQSLTLLNHSFQAFQPRL